MSTDEVAALVAEYNEAEKAQAARLARLFDLQRARARAGEQPTVCFGLCARWDSNDWLMPERAQAVIMAHPGQPVTSWT